MFIAFVNILPFNYDSKLQFLINVLISKAHHDE